MSSGVVQLTVVIVGAHTPPWHMGPAHIWVPVSPQPVALHGPQLGAAPHTVPSVSREHGEVAVDICGVHVPAMQAWWVRISSIVPVVAQVSA